jgi:hypothetical protein
MDARRAISLARATGRAQSRVADAFAAFAQERIAALGGLGLVPARPPDA